MKEKILEIINHEHYKPLSISKFATILDAKKSQDFKMLIKTMNELEDELVIAQDKDDKYDLLSRQGIMAGTFSAKQDHFGFFIPDDKTIPDIYIYRKNFGGAINGDRVLVKYSDKSYGHSKEGIIIRVVERKLSHIVGVLKQNKTGHYVIPDDDTINMRVVVDPKYLNGAVINHKVYAKIINFNKKGKMIVGIEKILGHMNDPGMDILSIVYKRGFSPDFPSDVLEQTRAINDHVVESDLKGRVDLRDKLIVTIDGDDAKDLDDAVSLEHLDNGNLSVGVHIADVSHYVKDGSPLDQEAFRRSTSVYLTDRVVPMLPHYLSNGICSLNGGVDRLTLSCVVEMKPNGTIVSHDIFPSVIYSKGRLTYKKVNRLFDEDPEILEEYGQYQEMLLGLKKVADIIRDKREKRGSLDFETKEGKILVDADGKPYDIIVRERGIAERLIEDLMLLANETVAEHLHWLELPAIYRTHGNPKAEKLQHVIQVAGTLGYNVHIKNNTIHPNVIRELQRQIKGKPEESVINTLLLRSMAKAKYEPENLGHYGLAASFYTHFTSPIRRYPDLIVHRLLRTYLFEKNIKKEVIERLSGKMDVYAIQTSKKERDAVEAERETDDMKKAEYMEQFIGEQFTGIISSITAWGMYVELDNTVEGLIRTDSLKDDDYQFDQVNMLMIGKRTKKIFRLGERLPVTVTRADKEAREVDFELVTDEAELKTEFSVE